MSKKPRRRYRAIVTFPEVTDHAIVRYLQRAKGFDMDAVRTHIADTCRVAISAGATRLKIEGVEFVFRDRTVVTVAPAGDQSA